MNRCGSCEYLKDCRDDTDTTYFDGPDYEKGHCTELKTLCFPDEYVCHYYKNRFCYIATAICRLLGFSDNCTVLSTIRDFRDNYIVNNNKELLDKYDIVGPKIAVELMKDYKYSEDKDLIYELYYQYIEPVSGLIKEYNYTKAISEYTEMVKLLKEYYSFDENNVEEKDNQMVLVK